MPSLTPQPERTETLTPLAEGAETLTAVAEGVETLTALAELIDTAAILVAGTLPSGTLYPGTGAAICATTTIVSTTLLCGASGPYPDPNDVTPPVVGLSLSPVAEDALTLTPQAEA